MGASYAPYLEYKDSEVEWVGLYPAEWSLTRVKFESYVKARVGWHGLKSDDFTDEGPYLVTGSDFKGPEIDWKECYHCELERYEQDPYIQLKEGDLLITKDGTIGKVALVNNLDGKATLNSGVFVVRPLSDNYTSRFYFWLLQSTAFTGFVDFNKTGSTIVHLYQATFVNFSYAMPRFFEQELIVNFLDHETAKIDTLIEKQQQLIALLKEKRQAVISHAVTKGLSPNAPMHDSGVEWLGEVPEHWLVSRVKFEYKNLDGQRIPLSTEERSYKQGEYPYYGATSVIDYVDDYIFDEDLVLVSEDGANLIMRSYPIAFPAYGKYWVNNHAHILRPVDENTEFWAEVIEVRDLTPYISGSAQPKFTSEALSNLVIAVPPTKNEVDEIALFIKKQKEKYSLLIDKAEGSIQLMQERRTALISAAVTGKIDVRNWVAPEKTKTKDVA
tara:strand:- start:5875 stop:7203 length:1329 start_codon:yes stop_codon:yes gene_type:complete